MTEILAKGLSAALGLLILIAICAIEATHYLRKIAKALQPEVSEWYPGVSAPERPSRIANALTSSFSESRFLGMKRHYWTVLCFTVVGIAMLVWINHALP